jgi:alanyl-tRNA synthetase
LHAALRQVIGPHVRQAGSLVAPDRLRFDFTAPEAVTPEQLAEVEALVNEKVRQDVPVHVRESSFDEAMGEGVLAFFGDKYGDRVRVVEVNTVMPRFSAELCGGTHCERTGEIGAIVITGESSIGSGMRRIEALSGPGAEHYIREVTNEVAEIARKIGAPRHAVLQKIDSLVEEREALRKRVEKLERSLASGSGPDDLLAEAKQVDGVTVRAPRWTHRAWTRCGSWRTARGSRCRPAAVLGTVIDEKPMFIALVTKDLTSRGCTPEPAEESRDGDGRNAGAA